MNVSDELSSAVKELLRRLGQFSAELDDNAVFTQFDGHVVPAMAAVRAALAPVEPEPVARPTFPILNGGGAKIDYQLVEDHGGQARDNHGQTVKRLAERGGLSWCELHAVLHNRKWEKMDSNDAMIACRALEAKYLAALTSPVAPTPSAEDDTERFLLAYVSQDTKVIGIEHPTEAIWQDVLAAHIALRDRLNLRIAEQEKCPFKPAAPTEADDLVAALEPFSEFAGYLFSKNANDDDVVAQTRVSSEFGAAVATLTFKPFRRARNALALRERTRAGGKP